MQYVYDIYLYLCPSRVIFQPKDVEFGSLTQGADGVIFVKSNANPQSRKEERYKTKNGIKTNPLCTICMGTSQTIKFILGAKLKSFSCCR